MSLSGQSERTAAKGRASTYIEHRAVAPGISFVSTKVEEVWLVLACWGIKDDVFGWSGARCLRTKASGKDGNLGLVSECANLWVSSKPPYICCQELLFKETE